MNSSIAQFAADLRRLPRVLALKVTAAAAPVLTDLARETFAAGETPYGVGWAPGAKGQKVTLRKTGALGSFLRYVAVGTKLRAALGTSYAKYQVGKRPVLPRQAGELPPAYTQALQRVAVRIIKEELGK